MKLVYDRISGRVDCVIQDSGAVAASDGLTMVNPNSRDPRYLTLDWDGPMPTGAVVDLNSNAVVADTSYRPPLGYSVTSDFRLVRST